MTWTVRRLAICLLLAAMGVSSSAQTPSPGDDVASRMKAEGLERSQVMATLSYLSDVIGPRLTASPNMKRANEWTRDKLTEWGLKNTHLEAWGPFGRGWSLERFSAQVVSPQDIPLIAYPKAWSPGLRGPITAEVVYVDANTEEELAKYHGRLRGAIVLNSPMRDLPAHFEAPGARYTDQQLLDRANATAAQGGRRPGAGGPRRLQGAGGQQVALSGRKYRFYQEEGVAVVVESARGDGGTMFVQSATVPPPAGATPGAGAAGRGAPPPPAASAPVLPPPGAPSATGTQTAADPAAAGGRARRAGAGQQARRVSPWDKDAPKIVPQIVVSSEQYNRMIRMVQAGEKLRMNVDLAVKFYDNDLMGYNTVAEIPGSDLKDEVVMLGGHMDSWHGGTGATDNGAGDAVCMEAVRIIQSLNLHPRRTIRIALWSGEEEGLLGSRAYVTQHFGARDAQGGVERKPEYDRFSSYFNLDNGTGKIRGIYLQGNDAVRSLFTDWLAPFHDLGATTVTISNTGGTDHQSFDGIGLPGFQFIQDPIEYDTRTHHSNQDVFDRIQGDDLKQASVIMAYFVYNAATRDDKLPRKPMADQGRAAGAQ